ncbi:glycine cleavage system protein GcvH [candidate division KSB1 bacterium]|nr:glycine cleavage system protein GcvH [candidate division KSB1 bacterium]
MLFPEKLKYSNDHEWVSVDGDVATVGITDYAQGELGDLVFVELPAPGSTVAQGESFGTIEAVKAVSDLFAPVSGEVIEINDALADDPEIVNKDPYGDGWMVKVRVVDAGELDALLDASGYKSIIS